MLIDANQAIRVRCRTGSPLLDPVMAEQRGLQVLPGRGQEQQGWQLASSYYAVHPSPPPLGPDHAKVQPGKPETIIVEKQLPPRYIVKRDTRTVTQYKPGGPAAEAQGQDRHRGQGAHRSVATADAHRDRDRAGPAAHHHGPGPVPHRDRLRGFRVRLALVVLAVAALGVTAPSASADDVWLWACHGPGGEVLSAPLGSRATGSGASEDCANPGGAMRASGNQAWGFTLPTGLALQNVRIFRSVAVGEGSYRLTASEATLETTADGAERTFAASGSRVGFEVACPVAWWVRPCPRSGSG